MKAVTHLEKVIAGEVSAVTHLEKVIAQETTAVTYTEKVIAGEAPPVTHLQKVIAGEARPVTHLEYVWAGGSPPSVQEYTGAVPVTFVADGTPLIDLLISGNEEHSGTPTPDNPIMPEGTGERTGNLWSIAPNANIGYNQDVDSDVSEAPGLLHVSASDNGMILTADSSWAGTAWKIKASVGMTYYISFASMSLNLRVSIYTADGNNKVKRRIANYSSNFPDNKELTILSDEQYIVISISVNTIATVEVTKPMITTNIIPYEPYGYKIPISSANITTPVYLGEVETTRKIGKLVLTGEENWTLSNNRLMYTVKTTEAVPYESVLCTHYTSSKSFIEVYNTTNSTAVTNQGIYVNSGSTDIADFKSYLAAQYAAGTPVTVWYVLATEETAVVNEPLMKIGDYADTLSMEQAGAQIPTANGSTTLDVETAVKPSEVYIKYRGEAVATLSMLSAEVSSPEETHENANPEETEETENGSEDISLQHEFEAIE